MGVRLACTTAASEAVVLIVAPDEARAYVLTRTLSMRRLWPLLPPLFPGATTCHFFSTYVHTVWHFGNDYIVEE